MDTTEFGIVYAVHITTLHFGSVASKVCECLLRKGPLSSRDISRLAESEINHNTVKDILHLLIQHNCVQAFGVETYDGSESKAIVQYIVLVDNILHRARYNKFLRVVNEELGSQCGAVLDGLLKNGRLTLGQLVERDRDSENPIGSEAIRDSLWKLVAARFVERIPSPEPVLGNILGNKEPEGGKKKRGAKVAKIEKELLSLEERILEAATPVDPIRFPLIFEQGSSSSLADNDSNISDGKRKQRDVESSDSSNAVIWRPNFEQFIRHLRHKACVEIVKERKDEDCAIVLKAMLEVARSQEKKVKTDKSVPMSVGSIYEEVIKTEAGRTMLQKRVKECLDQLSAKSSYLPPFVIVNEMDDSYIVDFNSIISVAQKDEMEAVVMRRYGKQAFRMFRYLSQEGQLVETDKIADAAMTEKKDTPQILLKMWKEGYLNMQKYAVAASYMPPYLLWKVNKVTVSRQMLDEMYHASLNLSLRLAHELDSEKELMMLPLNKLEGPLKERLNKIKAKRMLLTSTNIKLDDAIMLFHDF